MHKNNLKLRTPDLFGDYDQLGYAVEAGWVTEKDHPDFPELSIYTYTNECVFESIWTPVTKAARGLIVGPGREIVALPFPKSFLVDIHLTKGEDRPKYIEHLPDGPFRVTTKVDGSLAIIFWYEGKWRVATKGSFISDHAKWGQEYLDARDTGGLDRDLTYLAEMIIPEWGRIVVDNGDQEDMVLLGARSLYTGDYAPMEHLLCGWEPIGSVVQSWGQETDPVALNEWIKTNHRPDATQATGLEFEGVVLQWPNGFMAKAKMKDYIALHGIFTETTELGIWRVLSNGGAPEDVMETAPDEMLEWVQSVARKLEKQKRDLLDEVTTDYFKALRLAKAYDKPRADGTYYADRKEFAQAVGQLGSPYAKVLFQMFDDNTEGIDAWLWKKVRPYGKVTFRREEGSNG